MRAILLGGLALAAMAQSDCDGVDVPTPYGGTVTLPQRLLEQVGYEHGCPAKRIVYLQDYLVNGRGTVDLDVCGRVRRYHCVEGACADQTNAFPRDALPRPISPPGTKPAPPGERAPGAPLTL